jgi:hypothetical protein
VGNGNIDVGKQSPTRESGQPIVERLFGSNGLAELRIDQSTSAQAAKSAQTARQNICRAMAQQRGDIGNYSAPQELLQLVGCRERVQPRPPKAPGKS